MKTVLISFFAWAIIFTANAQQVPALLVGNWISTVSNDWEYGFFEKFAVYDYGFWDYSVIQQQGKTVKIALQKDGKTVYLEINQKNDSVLTIKNGKSKKQDFVLMRKRYPDYKVSDNTPFSDPTFRQDSATIIGYYQNFDKLPEYLNGATEAIKKRYSDFFMVVVNDFFADEQLEYQTEIDSLGRFKITVPIMNSQLVYVDWKRLNKTMLLSPNDTIFLFADMPDLLPQPSDKSWDDFRLRDKQILCMGTNARVNNELLYYKALGLYVNSEEEVKKGISDMEYLRICENVYNQRMAHLEKYIADYPAVSEKFRFVQTNEENYKFAFQLMQHRFDLKGKNFQEGYMDYVEKNILKFDPKVYTLVREYETFISDYIGYYSQNITIQSHISQFLEEAGLNTSENIKLLEDYDNFANKLITETDTLKQKKMIEENNKLMEKGNELFANPLIAKSREAYFRRALMDKYYHKADSLLQEPALKELWLTKRYVNDFEKNRIPWPNSDLQVIKTRITNPFLQSRLLEFNNDYLEIAKMDFVYPASFINTDDLEGEQNADTILKKIIAPYKGKVILMDFWGTWCGPCRRDMESSGDIKKAMFGKDLVFMYLANNSPESAWKNYLKKIQLTGEQIVHYRLPEQQQKLLEQKLDVHSFPTYFIIDREGNIRDSKLRFPLNFKNAVDELEKVL